MECLSESAVVEIVERGLPEAGEVRRHLDGCAGCRALVAEVARTLPDATPAIARSPTTFATERTQEDPPRSFEHEALGRYRLRRLIGEGAMGEVWAAHDEQLHRDVALKLLRVRAGAGPGAGDVRSRERLLREARALARLSHPNAVGVYDAGEESGRLFLALELVEGQTLREWLDEKPRRAPEVLSALLQAGRGLAAAHAAGLVHRDFKPDNVLIDRSGVARITDFGLARPVEQDQSADDAPSAAEPAGKLTRSGALVGTPAYMSPEQLDGRPADARADAFGFAVTLWEALYGERPFAGATLGELKAAIDAGRIRAPRAGKRVPAAVRRVLERALRPRADDRWPSLADFLAALERAASLSQRRTLFASAAALALLALAAALFAAQRSSSVASHQLPRGQRRAVAVLPLAGAGGADGWVATALPEMLAGDLAATEDLRAVPAESVARMFGDLGEQPSAAPTAELLARIRHRMGADYVVAGSHLREGDRLRLKLALYDAATGRSMAAVDESAAPADLIDAAARIGDELRAALGTAPAAQSATAAARSIFPAQPEAARRYAEGLASLRAFDAKGARAALEAAVAAEPDHPLPHAALADALSQLGYLTLAEEQGKRAAALAGRLPREDRLRLEARGHELAREWNKAYKIARGLFTVFSDEVEHGLLLARVQIGYGKAKEAFNTIRDLRKLPAPASSDPRISLAEADAADALTDSARQLAAAQRAQAEGEAQGSRYLIARALNHEAAAFYRMGRIGEALALREKARPIFHELGAFGAEVLAAVGSGWMELELAHLDEAKATLDHAVEQAHAIGFPRGEVMAVQNLAVLAGRRQDLAEAQRLNERGIELMAQLGDQLSRGRGLMNLGNVLRERGKLPEARARYDESLALRRELGETLGVARTLGNIAVVLAEEDDLAGAEKAHAELRKVAGNDLKLTVSSYDGDLAALRWQEGKRGEAHKIYEGMLAALEKQNRPDQLAIATATLGRLTLEQGDPAKARALALQGLALLSKSQNERAGYATRLEATYVLGSTGDGPERAARLGELTALTDQLGDRGLIELQLAARLLLGRLEMQAGRAQQGRERLSSLAAEASQLQFKALARQARTELATARFSPPRPGTP